TPCDARASTWPQSLNCRSKAYRPITDLLRQCHLRRTYPLPLSNTHTSRGLASPSEPQQITHLDKELPPVVQISRPTRQDRLCRIARSAQSRAQHVIVVLEIAVPSHVDRRARMRQPRKQRLRLHLLGALERRRRRVRQRRVILHNHPR